MINTKVKKQVAGITEMGSHIYTEITVSKDYTMNEVVEEIKRLGFVKFRMIDTMKTYAEIK